MSQLHLKAIILMAFLCLLISHNSQAKQATHQVYFSLSNEHGGPYPIDKAQQEFDCEDKIYSVIDLTNYPKGKHHLSIRWIDPSGKQREHTQYPFTMATPPLKLWGWLTLSRARGAGMLQFMNPAAGLEEFIGQWTVEIRINNKKVDAQNFEVSC